LSILSYYVYVIENVRRLFVSNKPPLHQDVRPAPPNSSSSVTQGDGEVILASWNMVHMCQRFEGHNLRSKGLPFPMYSLVAAFFPLLHDY